MFAGSGSGFISLWGKAQKDAAQASEFNVASVLSAETDVTLKARETDVDIIGSSVNSGRDMVVRSPEFASIVTEFPPRIRVGTGLQLNEVSLLLDCWKPAVTEVEISDCGVSFFAAFARSASAV